MDRQDKILAWSANRRVVEEVVGSWHPQELLPRGRQGMETKRIYFRISERHRPLVCFFNKMIYQTITADALIPNIM